MALPVIGDRVLYFPGNGEEGEGQGPFPAMVQHVLSSGQLHLLVHLQIDDRDAKEVERTCVQFLDVGPMNRVGAYCCSLETALEGETVELVVDEPADDITPPEQPAPDITPGSPSPELSGELDEFKLPTNPPSDPLPITTSPPDDETPADEPQ